MNQNPSKSFIAFAGQQCIANGGLALVVQAVKIWLDRGGEPSVLIFDAVSSAQAEVDFRGSMQDILQRLPVTDTTPANVVAQALQDDAARSVGRPKLGVVAREVTLLPRHWDWLASQPGGASVALRKLVEQASRDNAQHDQQRKNLDAVYQFMFALAGDEPGFEEASRALFAHNSQLFLALITSWPIDVRTHLTQLVATAFPAV
jgi:uncharacterized protein